MAISWTEDDRTNDGGKYIITFKLRPGVKFHDGTEWNSTVAEANFNMVFAEPLLSADYHGWYDLPKRIKGWRAVDSLTFEVQLDSPYYPALQELAYIRPLRMLSLGQVSKRPHQKLFLCVI